MSCNFYTKELHSPNITFNVLTDGTLLSNYLSLAPKSLLRRTYSKFDLMY